MITISRPGSPIAPEQQVVDGLERLLPALDGDRGDVASRIGRPGIVVEQHDRGPSRRPR